MLDQAYAWVCSQQHKLSHTVIKLIHKILNNTKLKMYPDKTYLGCIQKGFGFLGVHFGAMPTIAKANLEKHRIKLAQRYAQGASSGCIEDYVARWKNVLTCVVKVPFNLTNLTSRAGILSRFMFREPMRSTLIERNGHGKKTDEAHRRMYIDGTVFLVLLMVVKTCTAQLPEKIENQPNLWIETYEVGLLGSFPRINTYTANSTQQVTVTLAGNGVANPGTLCSDLCGAHQRSLTGSCLASFTNNNCTGTAFLAGSHGTLYDTMTFPSNKTYYAYLNYTTGDFFNSGVHSFQFVLADAAATACYVSDCIPVACTDATTCSATGGTYSLNINN